MKYLTKSHQGVSFLLMSLLTVAMPSCAQTPPPAPPTAAVSNTPKADFSQVPGVVITHIAASTHQFVGSPGLTVLPNGHYLAKCDIFGPGIDDEHIGTTPVFESADKGRTWTHLTDVMGMYWATIFVHKGAVYLLGTDHEYGDLVIMRSTDGGHTWTVPKDATTGLLRQGKFHCSAVPIVEHAGRLWRGTEDTLGPGGWGSMFRAFMLSVPVDADLLRADSWTNSVPLERNPAWNGGDFGGWLEGNAVVAPDGGIVDMLRIAVSKGDSKVAMVHISADGKTGTFDPQTDIIDFPGGATKFCIRYDPQTKLYWSLANAIPPGQPTTDPGSVRNTLALTSSPDLRHWTIRSFVLRHPDPVKHGFQYVDWQFDGPDLIAVSRTAFDDGLGGADSYHNANFLTFHRFANFRTLTMADSMPLPKAPEAHGASADFTITGHGFEMGKLAKGEKTFSNRTYVWLNVPAGFEGGAFTRLGGGVAAQITVRAKRATTLSIATALTQPGVNLNGWHATSEMLHYSDGAKTGLTVFTRALKSGEEITIPQGNWTGSVVLTKP